jgi:hypothetical protein
MPGAAQVNIIHGKIIYYYNYLFELYNPYKVIADWENELKRINEQFIQQPYNQDLNLPSHGRRAKADNEGTIRVRIIRGAGLIFTDKPEAFELYLNIKPENKTYHATLESEVHFEKKQVLDIEIPTEAIEEMVELAHDPSFLSLKNEDIFPNMVMMDGNDVTISVKTDVGNLTLESNLLDSTLWNGAILVDGDVIQTPFHLICAVAFEQLGIELDDEEEEEEEEEESPS